eukprot:scaffold257135_cov19-Prasinocladus_malaysianus.AAC.1
MTAKCLHPCAARAQLVVVMHQIRNPPIPSVTNPGEWLLPVYYTPSGMGHTKDQYAVMKWSSQPAASWPQVNTFNRPSCVAL